MTDTFFSPVSLTSQITSCCNLSVYVNYRRMGSCRGGPDTERSGSCSTAFYKNDIISHNDQHLDNLNIFKHELVKLFYYFLFKKSLQTKWNLCLLFCDPPVPFIIVLEIPKKVFSLSFVYLIKGLIRFDSACLA